MDKNIYTDDFERLLREKSDEFRMYPSKRIWHSIYNNIHPGRKWPSVAMGITMIIVLLLVGYLNTNNTNLETVSANNTLAQKIISQTKYTQSVFQNQRQYPVNSNEIVISSTANNNTKAASNNILGNNYNGTEIRNSSPVSPQAVIPAQPVLNIRDADDDPSGINKQANQKNGNIFITGINSLQALPNGPGKIADENNGPPASDQSGDVTLLQRTVIDDLPENVPLNHFLNPYDKKTTVIIRDGNAAVEKNRLAINKQDAISTEDKNWIENYALHNRPASKKWAHKLAWQIYASPSVVYRILYNEPNFDNTLTTTPFAVSNASQDINNAVNQKPSLGFEMGTGIQYSIFKGVKLKAGLQLNYTRYNSNAFQNTHPVATRLTMHNYKTNTSYEVYRTTPYSNKNGLEPVKLHNETFQLSLPIGADLKLIGHENLQWNIGLTIQPTFVAGGKSYLISSDRRNYVKETSMLNNWNLNAGFETFITYKANGVTWQVGPQFRTQLFSTNSSQFAVEERLLNYGLKVGVSKTLK